jgi:OmpA-OmpF porin, OOP family
MTMRLVGSILACVLALSACSRQPAAAEAAPPASTPVAATAAASSAPVAEAAPNTAPNLLSFANGTIMPANSDPGMVIGPMLMIDSSSYQNWVGDAKPQSFVFELPDTATIRTLEFDDDTSGMGGVDSGIKELTIEVSDVSANDGYQEVFAGTLAKGVNGQRFDVAKPLPGRWLRANFKSNHGGDSYSLTEIRAFGDAPPPKLATAVAGAYETVWGTYNVVQDGTSIRGCYQPGGSSSAPATFHGGIEGNIAKIRYIETDEAGTPGEAKPLLLVFARDGQRFFTGGVEGDSISDYHEVKRIAAQPNACAGKADDPMGSELAKAGRVAVYGINFDFNSATIRPESTTVLTQVADLLRGQPELAIAIEGHTDDIGGEAYNAALSGKRANAVKDWLVAAGIDGTRLEAIGKGAGSPVASNGTDIGRAQNRRVELAKR